MSELDDLLELMHGAIGRVGSVQATIVERQRPKLVEHAFRRFAEQVEFAAGGGYFHSRIGGVLPGEEADEHVWRVLLWAEGRRFREERSGPDFESIMVADGERWWDWSPAFGLRSQEDDPRTRFHGLGLDRLDPAPFLLGFSVVSAGESTVAGRPAIRVGVLSATGSSLDRLALEPGIAEAELILDAENGVVLRLAQLVDGEEASVREIEEIAFDEPIPASTFVFELPPGASARGREAPQPTTVDATASAASFSVFKLDPAPPGWRVQAFYQAATERPTLGDEVTLLYLRDDGGERVRICERTREHERPVVGPERRLERGGRAFVALGPEQPEGREPAELIFELNDTRIRMSSSELSLERLLELADRLVEA